MIYIFIYTKTKSTKYTLVDIADYSLLLHRFLHLLSQHLYLRLHSFELGLSSQLGVSDHFSFDAMLRVNLLETVSRELNIRVSAMKQHSTLLKCQAYLLFEGLLVAQPCDMVGMNFTKPSLLLDR